MKKTSGDTAFSLDKCPLELATALMWLELLTSARAGSGMEDQETLDEEILEHVWPSESLCLVRKLVEAHHNHDSGRSSLIIRPAHPRNMQS